MPGSETALEELMFKVLGDLIVRGCVAKISDDLYCGADTVDDLLSVSSELLAALDRCDLRLSPNKTIICPFSAFYLGWLLRACTLLHPMQCVP